ncbi:MAG: amidohydrolase family protein, partial [Planctomycetes bacterium]|nr:amidohydrolase family protein [Planctomycetota bacterium]
MTQNAYESPLQRGMGLGSPTQNSAWGGPFPPMQHRRDADATEPRRQDACDGFHPRSQRRTTGSLGRGVLIVLVLAGTTIAAEPEASILVTNARLVDGAGNPWYRGSLLIRGDRLEAVGARVPREAGRVIDAGGQVVCPGFIDVHNHCEQGLLESPEGQQVVRQGVTTLVGGPCGGGPVDMGAALRQLDGLKLGPNVCLLAGFNAMR